MPRKKKTSADYIAELEEFESSLLSKNVSLEQLKKDKAKYDEALLNRNEVIASLRKNWSLCNKYHYLRRMIKERKEEEQEDSEEEDSEEEDSEEEDSEDSTISIGTFSCDSSEYSFLSETFSNLFDERSSSDESSLESVDVPVLENNKCSNCRRRNFDGAEEEYKLHFTTVKSCDIRTSCKFKFIKKTSAEKAVDYCLCDECNSLLQPKTKVSSMNAWPSFIACLLFEQNIDSYKRKVYFHRVCGGKNLWRFVPKTMRKWWIDEISFLNNLHPESQPYDGCTVDYPPSMFEDKTTVFQNFNVNKNAGTLRGIIDAQNNKEVVDLRVLCMWTCTSSVFDAGHLPYDLVVQRYLPKIRVKLYSQPSLYKNVIYSSNQYLRKECEYDSMMLNDEWTIKPTLRLCNDGLQVLTCKFCCGGNDKLSFFTPRSINCHKLNSEITDQLAHCVQVPRISRPMKAHAYSTTFAMTQCHTQFSGVDTMCLTKINDFKSQSVILDDYELATLVGRPDIVMLLNQKVQKGFIPSSFAQNMIKRAKEKYTESDIRNKTQGATYVATEDMIHIHLFESSRDKHIKVTVDDNDGSDPVKKLVNRSWPLRINLLKTEDSFGFGTQFRSIPTTLCNPTFWTLYACISACKELWECIDSKNEGFKTSRWEGWLLTQIYMDCFNFEKIIIDKMSPFKRPPNRNFVYQKLRRLFYSVVANEQIGSAEHFFKCSINVYKMLFDETYERSVAVISNHDFIENPVATDLYRDTKVFVLVSNNNSTRDQFSIDNHRFEARVVCKLFCNKKPSKTTSFQSIRYMRHGNGFFSWWKQGKHENVSTKCMNTQEVFGSHEFIGNGTYLEQYITVYVKCSDLSVDVWKKKIFESFGGMSHVVCNCCMFPLIPTHRARENLQKCNIQRIIRRNGENGGESINMNSKCKRNESFVCSNIHCITRMCKQCYNEQPKNCENVVFLASEAQQGNNNSRNVDGSSDNSFTDEYPVENTMYLSGNESDSSDESVHKQLSDDDSYVFDDNHVPEEEDPDIFQNFITTAFNDPTMDISPDNVDTDQGVVNTDGGISPINVTERYNREETVSGHIIFNQVGSCTQRRNFIIQGSNRQRHFTQSLASTSPGQVSPLLQPESSIRPSHFYASAALDKTSILGAQPVFLYKKNKHPYGFSDTLSQARIHMLNQSSTTFSDNNFMCFYFDQLANKLLSSCHSNDLFSRGFQVDTKSTSGLGVRDKGASKLGESVESRQIVLGLACSQRWVRYTWFLTHTVNQAMHPGIFHLHEWKESMKWTENVEGYECMSEAQKEEIKRAFENTYGQHIFNNWHIVKFLFLYHLKSHLTVLGTASVIFARDEYQTDNGNLCHNHLILAIDKSTMNEESEKYIQDLIRTSSMEVVKSDEDVQRLIESGLLKSTDEIPFYSDLALRILNHICNKRCLRRIGPGDSEENFRCAKPHPVKDNPDPTKHSYVPLKYKFSEHTLKILEDVGIYSPPTSESEEGVFTHSFFAPKRHIAPCMSNATDNMSSVIPDFFVAFKSCQNAQALDHTNGISKYVCKYIGKFDEGNYVMLLLDPNTGQWIVAKTHLHNTKVVSSQMNENKAFNQDRMKHHPKGRDMSHFEIRQILMSFPEVNTNLELIKLSTLPFELRQKSVSTKNDADDVAPDGFSSSIPAQEARMQFNIRNFSPNQVLTYRNHDGVASKYDMISIFSMRPVELVPVFRNPVYYFRYCYISDEKESLDSMKELCDSHRPHYCLWFDLLGRRVYIRKLAMDDVLDLIEKNREQGDMGHPNNFLYNDAVKQRIRYYNSDPTTLPENAQGWWKRTVRQSFYEDENNILPIPVVSCTSPSNPHNFLVHIVLSLGNYETEIDAMTHASTRDMLIACQLCYDAEDGDDEILTKSVNELTYKYIDEQVVWFPNSLGKSEKYIQQSRSIFRDAILYNSLSMIELPPFSSTNIRLANCQMLTKFWDETKESQLDSIYRVFYNTRGIVSREEVVKARRHEPIDWDAVGNLVKFHGQSDESFVEQKGAIDLFVKHVKEYRVSAGERQTQTNNVVVYGAPGTGKSFICQYVVLYCISQGLNIMSTALMGVRANELGGKHIHKIFYLPTNNKSSSPFVAAEKGLQKVNNKKDILFGLKTIDILFIDEIAQVSSEQLSTLELILRKVRGSQVPFGGVLIFGSMDHTQLQPINQLPLLTSSLILTCFNMYKLEHSVRAHDDIPFQRLQQITRMNPSVLRDSPELKDEFKNLCSTVLTFARDWNDEKISPNMTRVFSCKVPAKKAIEEFLVILKQRLDSKGSTYVTSKSRDTQRNRNTHGEFLIAENPIPILDRELKEPKELVFFAGGVYECTINDPSGRYSQSQLAFMLDVPSAESVSQFSSILLWIAPPGLSRVDFDSDNLPTRDHLNRNGWTEVRIGITPERIVSRGAIEAKRCQYSLKHIGAITIDKSQGSTVPYGLAVEITRLYSPWLKGQIVVILSRTTSGKATVIVGNKEYAINKMWELICMGTQWTPLVEKVLSLVTVNGTEAETHVLDYPSVYPFLIQQLPIPTDDTGYVYCLVSVRQKSNIYIGETKILTQRLDQHNRGHGSSTTSDPNLIPWALASYICGLKGMPSFERRQLENDWKEIVRTMISNHQNDPFLWICAGQQLVSSYNEHNSNRNIRFIQCVDRAEI